jgi:hypothetical protein
MWNKSVRIYGPFGKNSSQASSKIIIAVFLCLVSGCKTARLLKTHGTKARNKFQFRNKKACLPV